MRNGGISDDRPDHFALIELDPNENDGPNFLALYHQYNGEYEQSPALLKPALDSDPMFFPARVNTGEIRRQMGDPAGSIREQEKVLEQDPKSLLALTSLRFQTDWETMVFMEEGALARQHYGYVGAFVEYVERRFGIGKIREYSSALSWGKDPDAVFAQVYGSPLEEIEGQFLSDTRAMRGIEEEIEIVAPPLVPRVVIRWTLVFVILAFAVLWTIRQVFRASRFASKQLGALRRNMASP